MNTSFLLPSPPLVADFDGADGEDDGHDEEEDSADESGSDCPAFDVFRKVILELLADGVSRGRVGEDAKPVGLSCAHVFH